MKAYITKYAMTAGIQEKEGKAEDEVFTANGELWGFYHGNDWHKTFAEAAAHAETMRKKKIASLKKQIEKLEALKFDAPKKARKA